MNDKNFIEELRQKREEYGVTQRKLAVACGISRTYFNQIENGTVVPSAELKQTIEKQIERFNPQEPLFLLIDYFRVRFPTTDALKIIRDVLQLKADYMLYEDFGKYGYESKYVLGDINIMCSMQEHLGVLLELKGRGCRQMESYLLAQERSWYVPLPHITPHTLRHTFCTRLAQKNMNPKNLQYIMGHSNITITLNLYAHASEVGANKEMRSMIA